MLHTNNRLHGDGKVNTGVTTKLSKIKSCNRIVVKAYEKNNIYRHSWVAPLNVLLTTHFLFLRHLPAIVRMTRLEEDPFHFWRFSLLPFQSYWTENRIFTLCRMITWSVSQNVLKFYQLTGEERRVPFIFGRNNQ